MSDRLGDLRAASQESDFVGFRCWIGGDVGEIMHREAAMPSRAVLLATHQPPKIRRVNVTEAGRYGTEDVIGQDELLERVRHAEDQALIVPVIGSPGTGKSHLVLWLRARLDEEGDPNRKVVYLPKGETRLDHVIERIIGGRTGPPFDDIRDSVANATASLTLDDAARALRDALSLAIGNLEVTGSGDVAEMRSYLSEMLPDLLDDPVFAQRLVKGEGPLRRIVEQVNSGGNETPAELGPDDLDVQVTEYDLPDFSAPARTVLNDLNSDPQLYTAAVDLLNSEMSRCLGRVFGVQPMQLVAVMRELRTRLYEENPDLELVLMIEDFTLLQGIQHDLLEAMIELPRRDGQQVMCAMKTVMAVTDGFFTRVLASSDTLRTRIAAQGHVYNLDMSYGAGGEAGLDLEAVVDFAGRYLNAVRLGTQELDDAAPAVHNACDVCAHRDVCLDAFGTARDTGYGLYPFNDAALDRMVRSRQETFNPRDLLKVLISTLTAHVQDLADGRFPSPGWARDFDPRQFGQPVLDTLLPRLQEQIEQTPKAEQRSVLLTFWGGVPSEFRNLPAGIHEAFAIPVVSGVPAIAPAPPKPKPKPGAGGVQPHSTTNRFAAEVQSWRDGSRLDREYALIIRRVLHEAILGALNAEDALVSDQFLSAYFDKSTDIHIENSDGGGRPGPGRFSVELKPSNENALLFEAILTMEQNGSWDIDDGAQALVRFLTLVDAEASRLRAFLHERIAETDADRHAAVALLALSGLAARGGAGDGAGLLAAAMDVSEASPSEAMPPLWRALVENTAQRRPVVREFVLQAAHVSKSTSEPAGVDGSRFAGTLRAFASDWQLPEVSDDAPNPVARLQQVLDLRLQPALDEAHETLTAWHEEMVRLVGNPESAATRYKEWRAALDAAQAQGFLVRARGFDTDPPARLGDVIRTVGGILDRWAEADLGRRVALIAKAPWLRLEPVRGHLVALEETLTASMEKARTQQGAGGEASPVDAFEQALARVESASAIEVPA
jgi:hypothetical protein